jgi:PTH1 family peptidyl-tRNA hydrolase
VDRTFLIVGLGNPGSTYQGNRHNIGFMVLDRLLSSHGDNRWQERFKGQHARLRMGDAELVLLKPRTFMNLSGQSVSAARAFYKCEVPRILVVHDDIDLAFGVLRLKTGGGTGGHKGIESMKKELGDAGFHRLRIGVGRPVHGDVSDFVLKDFSLDERGELQNVVGEACEAIEEVVRSGMTAAMNRFNRRPEKPDGD